MRGSKERESHILEDSGAHCKCSLRQKWKRDWTVFGKMGGLGGSVGVFRAGTEAGPLMDADGRKWAQIRLALAHLASCMVYLFLSNERGYRLGDAERPSRW